MCGERARDRTDCRTTTVPATDDRFAVPLRGVAVDDETRCRHWHDAVDVIALRFACCDTYYPCAACHAETTDHDPKRWPRDRFGESAVLCGVCRTTLTVESYLDSGDACPDCGASFNPGCRSHRHLYFEL
jgi:uncharacterized CHY-type Zn-finger protein